MTIRLRIADLDIISSRKLSPHEVAQPIRLESSQVCRIARREFRKSSGTSHTESLIPIFHGPFPFLLTFREVSNIDQQLRNPEAHAGCITAPPSAFIGDRECCAPA